MQYLENTQFAINEHGRDLEKALWTPVGNDQNQKVIMVENKYSFIPIYYIFVHNWCRLFDASDVLQNQEHMVWI